jgi:hypothetical protein
MIKNHFINRGNRQLSKNKMCSKKLEIIIIRKINLLLYKKKITRLQHYKITRLRDYKITRLQDYLSPQYFEVYNILTFLIL